MGIHCGIGNALGNFEGRYWLFTEAPSGLPPTAGVGDLPAHWPIAEGEEHLLGLITRTDDDTIEYHLPSGELVATYTASDEQPPGCACPRRRGLRSAVSFPAGLGRLPSSVLVRDCSRWARMRAEVQRTSFVSLWATRTSSSMATGSPHGWTLCRSVPLPTSGRTTSIHRAGPGPAAARRGSQRHHECVIPSKVATQGYPAPHVSRLGHRRAAARAHGHAVRRWRLAVRRSSPLRALRLVPTRLADLMVARHRIDKAPVSLDETWHTDSGGCASAGVDGTQRLPRLDHPSRPRRVTWLVGRASTRT